MPASIEAARIRAILEMERAWAVYALGDLEPPHAQHCEWHLARDDSALLLLYRVFATPVIFTLGAPAGVEPLLDELDVEGDMYLSVRPEILPLIRQRYTVRHERPMWRMRLKPERFVTPARVESSTGLIRLGPAHMPALEALYADGMETGEAPDFFNQPQLEQGVFYGVCERRELIAAAGTHLLSVPLSLGAVGNVYTRRDRRGRGLGRLVTAAVTAELVRLGLETIALNVSQQNTTALHVYEALGYERYCAFYEGLAQRRWTS